MCTCKPPPLLAPKAEASIKYYFTLSAPLFRGIQEVEYMMLNLLHAGRVGAEIQRSYTGDSHRW